MKNKIAVLAALVMGATSSAISNADEIILDWDINQYAAFSSFSGTGIFPDGPIDSDYANPSTTTPPSDVIPGNPTFPAITGDTWLNWGVANDPNLSNSQLFITAVSDPAAGCDAGDLAGDGSSVCGGVEGVSVTTNGAAVDTLVYNHLNNDLTAASDELVSGTITGRVDLFADVIDDSGLEFLFSDYATYSFDFAETSNTTTPCAIDLGPDCADILGIYSPDLQFSGEGGDFVAFFSDTISIDGYGSYLIIVELQNLQELDDGFCPIPEGAAEGTPCVGLVTEEGLLNSFISNIRIVAVPAPAVPALLGLGLLALFGVRRKMAS